MFLVGDLLKNVETILGSKEIAVKEPIFPAEENVLETYEYNVLPYFKDEKLCYIGEVYHEQDNICTLPVTCTSNSSCTAWGDSVIKELETHYSGFSEFYGFYSYEDEHYSNYVEDDYFENNFDPIWVDELIGSFEFGDGYDEEVIAAFPLENFELVFPDGYEDEYDSNWYWEEFKWIIPSEQLWMLDSFSLFIDDELLAYVVETESDLSKWHLGINMSTDIRYQDSISTHVHEFAHLLFLNSNQMDPLYEVFFNCDFYIDDKGCAKDKSYNTQFSTRFGNQYDGIYVEDEFVSEYAATDLLEDMAETFYMFVLTPKPTGDSIAEQKILFFYEHDELVLLRAEILSRVATYMYRVL